MDKNARISTKTSRGRGWRNQKRPDQQFYVPGALHRKKQQQNTDNAEKNMGEQSRGTRDTSIVYTLQKTRMQENDNCTNSSICTKIDQNAENKEESMADQSLSSEMISSVLKQELASGLSDSKLFELNRNTVEILSCVAQCDDQEQSSENKGERLADQIIQIPTLVTQKEFKSKEVNVCNTNKLEKNIKCLSETDANDSSQMLSCERVNTQGLVLSKFTCAQSEDPNEHSKTVDISEITTENTELDNSTERTMINDLKEGDITLSLHNNNTSNESLEKLKDDVKNQHEKDVVMSKETYEKCISIEDITQVDKDSENNDAVQADKLYSSSLRKEEMQHEHCTSICEAISNDITKKVIINNERTEIQCEQTRNDNTCKSKDIDDTKCTKIKTKESVREDKQQCHFEKTSNSENVAERDLQYENGLEQTMHLCSVEKTEIVSISEIDNTSCSEILETLQKRVDDHGHNLTTGVPTERKAKITHLEDKISENYTEKSDSMVSENKEEQPSKVEKVKKKKKNKKSDHLDSKEVKKKKKKKEHCEGPKDEESELKDKKAKCTLKTKVKEKEEGICKEEVLDQDGEQAGEDDSVDDDDDSDSWLNKFNDDGECLDPELIKELSKATGIKKPIKHKTQFDFYSLAEKDIELDDGYGHIVEIYDFSADLKTQDLTKALSAFKDQGYELKWVDDTHALAAFASPLAANQAIQMCSSPLLKLRPVSQGIAASKKKAQRCFEFLQPYKPRPQTTKLTAHMLVTGALGVKSRMTKEEKQKEKDKLKEAREQKRQEKQRKADIWGD